MESVFVANIDYAQLNKIYNDVVESEKRYSPTKVTRVTKNPIMGYPKIEKISTSHVERQNLTMRMSMRRLTRLTNAFSKKLYNLQRAIDLHFFYYNFIRIHRSLQVTPAMESGITKSLWNWDDLFGISARRKAA